MNKKRFSSTGLSSWHPGELNQDHLNKFKTRPKETHEPKESKLLQKSPKKSSESRLHKFFRRTQARKSESQSEVLVSGVSATKQSASLCEKINSSRFRTNEMSRVGTDDKSRVGKDEIMRSRTDKKMRLRTDELNWSKTNDIREQDFSRSDLFISEGPALSSESCR